MLLNKKFWTIETDVPSLLAPVLADALSESALAVTVLAPPRKKMAHIEWLYDTPPLLAPLEAQMAVLGIVHGIAAPSLQIRELPRLDWLKKVAEDFPPLVVGPWTIHGAQHRKAVPDRRHALQIDATSAFGTGEHPTTRGCLLTLAQVLKSKNKISTLLDMGCGSGILAIAFAKKTHQKAVAIDLDPLSIQIARTNRHINGLQKNIRIGLGRGYISPLVKKRAPYDMIMSNIFAGPLSHMAKDLKRHLRPGGVAILAGLLTSQKNKVVRAHNAQGLRLIKQISLGEWSILVFQHPKRA